jgi:hypothetical protein
MRCVEYGIEADQTATGWRAYLVRILTRISGLRCSCLARSARGASLADETWRARSRLDSLRAYVAGVRGVVASRSGLAVSCLLTETCSFETTCGRSSKGVVAKRLSDPYKPGERGWIKTKNRAYWRFGQEREPAGWRRDRI